MFCVLESGFSDPRECPVDRHREAMCKVAEIKDAKIRNEEKRKEAEGEKFFSGSSAVLYRKSGRYRMLAMRRKFSPLVGEFKKKISKSLTNRAKERTEVRSAMKCPFNFKFCFSYMRERERESYV